MSFKFRMPLVNPPVAIYLKMVSNRNASDYDFAFEFYIPSFALLSSPLESSLQAMKMLLLWIALLAFARRLPGKQSRSSCENNRKKKLHKKLLITLGDVEPVASPPGSTSRFVLADGETKRGELMPGVEGSSSSKAQSS